MKFEKDLDLNPGEVGKTCNTVLFMNGVELDIDYPLYIDRGCLTWTNTQSNVHHFVPFHAVATFVIRSLS